MVLRMLVLLMIMSPAEGALDDGFDDDCDCEEDDDSNVASVSPVTGAFDRADLLIDLIVVIILTGIF